jgi:hypothetical protein
MMKFTNFPQEWNGLVAKGANARVNRTHFPIVQNTWHETFVDWNLSIKHRIHTGVHEFRHSLFDYPVQASLEKIGNSG